MADRTFIVNVGVGTPPLGYQWQGVLVGQNPAIPGNWLDLGTANQQTVDDAVYDWVRCVVSNAYGNKTSDPFELNPVVQTVTVQFVSAASSAGGDLPSAQPLSVSIITSDGNPLVAPVSVDVRDTFLGTAGSGLDYTMATPQTLNWNIGDADGTVKDATVNVLGANSPDCTVNADLDPGSPAGATLGGQTTHTFTIINIGA